MKGVFIFRRDFRLTDNPGLYELSKECDKIIGVFILDEDQPTLKKIQNNHSYTFMINSLNDFNEKYLDNKLVVKKGKIKDVINEIIKDYKPDMIGFNRDYSEYSIKRDKLIEELTIKNQIKLKVYDDEIFLNKGEKYIKEDGKAYVQFAAYMNAKEKNKIEAREIYKSVDAKKFIKPTLTKSKNQKGNKKEITLYELIDDQDKKMEKQNYDIKDESIYTYENVLIGLERCKDMEKEYEKTKRRIDIEHSQLAVYLKYGLVSIVEVCRYFQKNKLKEFERQLHFRNFYFLIRRYNYNGYDHYDKFYKEVKWENSYDKYKRMWITCDTGYPVIDACVRKLKATGWLNNRSNLLVSFFSIKILHIDPFHEKYGGQKEYSKHLIYCCYANNYCNWNFTLGVFDRGSLRYTTKPTKAGRYFDVTNIRKLDPDLKIIREYIPELKDVPDKDVYKWNEVYKKYPKIKYKPMLECKKEFQKYEYMTRTKKSIDKSIFGL